MSVDMPKDQLETPALLIDLDALEKNIKTMGDYYRAKKGAALRPHQKGHRLPTIAKKQMDAGAIGVASTSLGLAEFYVKSGIDEILVTAEICGASKIAKLCALSKHADITVSVDDLENIRQLSETALANGRRIKIAAELYMGLGSAGVELSRAKDFVLEIQKYRGVEFKGLWWHAGQLGGVQEFEKRRDMEFKILDDIVIVKDDIEDAGINVEMLSGGFSCTWNITPEYQSLRNVGVQAGSYVFSDWVSHSIEGLEVFDYALTVLTRCISRPKTNEAILDAGMNSCSFEHGEDYVRVVGPEFKDLDGIERVVPREELTLAVFKSEKPEVKVGDLFELIPPHSDTTAKLHDKYYGIRDGKVEVIWPNYGRGLF